MKELLFLYIGLVLVIVANMLLGSINALMNGKFNKKKLGRGIVKGSVVTSALVLLMVAGLLNPNVKITDDLTLPLIIQTITLSAFVYYTVQTVAKLKDVMYPKDKEVSKEK